MLRPFVILLAVSILSVSMFSADGEIRFGAILDLSGSNAQVGEGCRQGIELALHAVPASDRVRMILSDHKGEARNGVSDFKKLTTVDKVSTVLVQRSQVGMAVNPLALESKLPLIGIVGHMDFLRQNPHAFRSYPSTEVEGAVLAKAAREKGLSKVVTITLEDEWTLSFEESFAKEFEKLGGRVIATHRLHLEEYDISPLVPRMRALAPDAILVNLNIPLSGSTIRRLREKGFNQPILSNFWGATREAIAAAEPKNADGLLYPSVNLEKPRFRKEFARMFPGSSPVAVTYTCYAGIVALSQIVSSGARRTEQMDAALRGLSRVRLWDEELLVEERSIQFDVRAFEIKG